jgi:hypothetical protein
VAGMLKFVPKSQVSMKIVYAWIAVGAVGLVLDGANLLKIVDFSSIALFYPITWFLLIGIGFAYTGYLWSKAKEAYYAGAALNFLCLIGIFAAPQLVGPNLFLLLGISSVLPVAYGGYKN